MLLDNAGEYKYHVMHHTKDSIILNHFCDGYELTGRDIKTCQSDINSCSSNGIRNFVLAC